MLGARVPADYKSFSDSYGAHIIHDLLHVSQRGSSELNTLELFARDCDFLHKLPDSDDPLDRITRPPMDEAPGGMLMWGHTDVGDYCFLQPVAAQAWAVCVWYREGEWHERNLFFSEWLHARCRAPTESAIS